MDLTTWIGESASAHHLRIEAALTRVPRAGQPDPRSPVEEELYETLVEDHREALRPAQHVERKLVSLLQASAVFLSHLQKDGRPRRR